MSEDELTDQFIYNWLNSNSAKNKIWVELGQTLGVTASRVHNYYHNTWSRQFYTDAELYKKQIYEIMESIYSNDTPTQDLIQITKEKFCERFSDISFHSGYLLQLIYRISYQLRNKNKCYKALSADKKQKKEKKLPIEKVTIQPEVQQKIDDLKKYLKYGK